MSHETPSMQAGAASDGYPVCLGVVRRKYVTKHAGTTTMQVREEPERATSTGKKSTTINDDISTALDPLEGSCATLARGYWSYKWCHRKSVIQVTTCLVQLEEVRDFQGRAPTAAGGTVVDFHDYMWLIYARHDTTLQKRRTNNIPEMFLGAYFCRRANSGPHGPHFDSPIPINVAVFPSPFLCRNVSHVDFRVSSLVARRNSSTKTVIPPQLSISERTPGRR